MMEKYSGAMEVLIAATVMAFLGLLSLIMGPLYFLVMILLPIPLVYLILRRDLLYSLYAVLLTVLMLMVAFANIQSAVLLALQFVPLGLLIGLMLKNKVKVSESIAVLLGWALLLTVLNLLSSFGLSGTGIAQTTDELRVSMEEMAQFYQQNGLLDEENRQQYQELTEGIVGFIQTFMPGIMAVWHIVMALITYFIAIHWMQRLKLIVAKYGRFTDWQMPWYSIWLIIIGLVLALAGDKFPWQLMEVTGKNILYVAAFIFFIQGLAVIIYYFQLWKISKLVKFFLIVFLLFYLPFAAAIALIIGVIDPVINLRRRKFKNDGDKGD